MVLKTCAKWDNMNSQSWHCSANTSHGRLHTHLLGMCEVRVQLTGKTKQGAQCHLNGRPKVRGQLSTFAENCPHGDNIHYLVPTERDHALQRHGNLDSIVIAGGEGSGDEVQHLFPVLFRPEEKT